MSAFTDAMRLLELDNRGFSNVTVGQRLEALGISEDDWMAFGPDTLTQLAHDFGLRFADLLPAVSQLLPEVLIEGLIMGVTYGRLTADTEVPR